MRRLWQPGVLNLSPFPQFSPAVCQTAGEFFVCYAENAWTVVYPQQEYDFLNLSGITATGQHFEPPHYDYIMVEQRNDSDCEGYFFNIGEMLKQYFLKHPGELQTMRNRSQEQE